MQCISEDQKSFIISVLPLLDIDKESFSSAFLQLDRGMAAADRQSSPGDTRPMATARRITS